MEILACFLFYLQISWVVDRATDRIESARHEDYFGTLSFLTEHGNYRTLSFVTEQGNCRSEIRIYE